ncbi:MAG: AzlD domain-containing protein [Parvibaculales bacterium]
MSGPSEHWVLLGVAVAGTFIWRFLGVALSRYIETDSRVFIYINSIAYAMITGLMFRIVVFPSGALAHTALLDRVFAFTLAMLVCMWKPEKSIYGVIIGLAVFSALVVRQHWSA